MPLWACKSINYHLHKYNVVRNDVIKLYKSICSTFVLPNTLIIIDEIGSTIG